MTIAKNSFLIELKFKLHNLFSNMDGKRLTIENVKNELNNIVLWFNKLLSKIYFLLYKINYQIFL